MIAEPVCKANGEAGALRQACPSIALRGFDLEQHLSANENSCMVLLVIQIKHILTAATSTNHGDSLFHAAYALKPRSLLGPDALISPAKVNIKPRVFKAVNLLDLA